MRATRTGELHDRVVRRIQRASDSWRACWLRAPP